MRVLAVTLAALVIGTGCGSQSYRIPNHELYRLSMLPPEQRGQRVRVVQETHETEVPTAQPWSFMA